MPTRNVVLTEHQHQLIESLVSSGQHQNASEILREGLRLVEQQHRENTLKLEALQRAAEAGWTDIDSWRFEDVPLEGIKDFVMSLDHGTVHTTSKSH